MVKVLPTVTLVLDADIDILPLAALTKVGNATKVINANNRLNNFQLFHI